jgi:serine protease Do
MAREEAYKMDDQNRKPDDLHGYSPEEPTRDDPYANVRKQSEPYTFGPFGSNQTTGGQRSYPEQSQPDVIVPVSSTKEYRPFTVSGGSRDWGSKPPRRSSFRSMFTAFLVGVVTLGSLMFAADHYNWFSSPLLGGTTDSQAAAAKPAGSPVNNTADVVRPNNIAKIFEQSSPAVVKIETFSNTSTNDSGSGGSGILEDPFFRQFFGDNFGNGDGSGNGGNQGGDSGALQPSGMGSGFIFDSTGYILTNQHVIAGANEIKVTVNGHKEPLKAKLLGSSYELDLAVLKIEGKDFPTLKLGDSSSLNMGDWVVAIGNPYGFDHTVTVGVLSSNEREISIPDANGQRNYQHLLQTDASINPGNSGGPLLNLKGEVVGINTAVSAQAQGIGFAIPTSTITQVLDNLKSNTKIPQKPAPFIGATLAEMNADIAARLGISADTKGAFVREVLFGSPAYKADLRQYDVITGLDGANYNTRDELIAAIQKKAVGDKVKLNVIRADKKLEIPIEIGDRNEYQTQ